MSDSLAFVTAPPVMKSELDLFVIPAYQAQIDKVYSKEFFTHTNPNNNVIELVLDSNDELYTDLSTIKLHVHCKILKAADNTNITAEDKVAPCNNLIHSLWKETNVWLNNQSVSEANDRYPYRAYLETLLSYNNDTKATIMVVEGWKSDTAEKFDDFENNKGMKKRQGWFVDGKTVELVGRPHCDFFQQPLLLTPGQELKIALRRSTNSFVLVGANAEDSEKYKLEITKIYLTANRVLVNPNTHAAILRKLNEDITLKYPMNKVSFQSHHIQKGDKLYQLDRISDGRVPKRFVFGLVTETALNGDFNKNPLKFHHHNVTKVRVQVDSEDVIGSPLDLDFSQKIYANAYLNLMEVTSINHRIDKTCELTMEEYAGGYTLFAFDMSNDQSSGSYLSNPRTGSIRITFNFSTNLTESLYLLIFKEHQSLLEIDKNNTVLGDFHNL